MPEARPGRGVRVVAGDGKALGLRREPVPAQRRRDVLAAHAEAVVDVIVGHLLAIGDIVTLDGERGHLRQDVMRERSTVSHGYTSRK